MNKLVFLLLGFLIVASGCLNQSKGPQFNPENSEQVYGMEVSYDNNVPESYVENFATGLNASDDVNRVAFENTGDGYGIKIYTKRSSVENINNLDTEENANKISTEMFDGAKVMLYIATMEGEVAQKASSN